MKQADTRPRIHIEPARDRSGVTWSRHPAAVGQRATTPGQAVDQALAELGGAPAVIIWGGQG